MKKKNTKKDKTIKNNNTSQETLKENKKKSEVKNNEKKISIEEKLQANIREEKDKYLRLYAEFENFRKRTSKEKLEMYETAGEKVIKNLLPILDDFERALAEMQKNKEDELAKGVQLIFEKLIKTLEKENLNQITIKKGDSFDPEIHEAIAQIPTDDKKLKGKIIDVVEKGYQLGNKIIRFPKVVTGKA